MNVHNGYENYMEASNTGEMNFAILDHVPTGICVLGNDYRILFWNLCLEKWTGIEKTTITGSDVREFFPDMNKTKAIRRIDAIFQGGPPAVFSTLDHGYLFPSKLRGDGKRNYRITVSRAPSTQGDAVVAIFAVEDVTELTNKIEACRIMQDETLDEVKQRKKAQGELSWANRKILEQQKTVIEEERLKVFLQTAGATAHEMNQPLMVLLANVEMMGIVKDNPEKLEHRIRKIETAANKISSIVKKMQNIRHAHTKAHDVSTSIIDFNHTINILYIETSDKRFSSIEPVFQQMQDIHIVRQKTIEAKAPSKDSQPFEIIILGCTQNFGLDAFEKIRNLYPELPIIAVTEPEDELTATRMIMAGASEYIPLDQVNEKSIEKAVADVLENQKVIDHICDNSA